MKTTVTEHSFRQAFYDMNRGDTFSYEGLAALFEWLNQYEEDTGEEMELDVIALCCDFREYRSLAEFQDNYGEKYKTFSDIEQKTFIIEIDDKAFIVYDF